MKTLRIFWGIFVISLCSAFSQAHAETRILFLGDSLTEGYNLPPEAAFPAVIQTQFKSKGRSDIICINAGTSGSTSASGLGRLKWHLKGKQKPDILVLALGSNDGLRGQDVAASKKNLVEIIKLAKEQNMKVLLAGMQMPPNYGKDYTKRFEAMFADIAREEKVALIPFLLDGVAAKAEYNLPDGIHPNEKGYKIVATTVLKHLEPLITP